MAIPLPSGAKGVAAPKTTVTGGNNPRGTAIVTRTTPKMLLGGANPRGVSIIKPAYSAPKQAAPKAKGGGSADALTAAALNPATVAAELKGGTSILGTLGNQILHLPQTTVEGIEQTGVPMVQAIGQLLAGHTGAAAHTVGHLGSQIISGDPVISAIRQGSLNPLAKNPLGTLMDASMVYGGVGDALGAGMRAAGADTAALGREARPLTPGDVGNAVISRGYSRNYFTGLMQRAMDNLELPKAVRMARTNMEIRQSVATDHAAEAGVRSAMEKEVKGNLKGAKPKDKAVADVTPMITRFGTTGTGDAEAMLSHIQADYERNGGQYYDPTDSKNSATFKGNIDKALSQPRDYGQAFDAARAYAPVQDKLEAQMADLEMRSNAEMANANRRAYMLQREDVHPLEKPAKDPALYQRVQDAGVQLKQAIADREAAQRERDVTVGIHKGASRELATQTRKMPLHWANDRIGTENIESRQILDASSQLTKALNDEHVKNLIQQEKAARAQVRDAVKAWKNPDNKLRGTMIEDPNVPAIREGALKGLRVRPVNEADYQSMLANEHSPLSYVSMKNPARERPQALSEKVAGRTPLLAETGRKGYTGEAVKVGDVHPGWGAMVRSQLNTVRAISREREMQGFMEKYAEPKFHATIGDARASADAYEKETGVKLDTVQWKGALRNVPHTAVSELQRQFNLDNPGKLAKTIMLPNRLFRMTVLPFSPRLPIMHSVENLSRVSLLEGDPLRAAVRAPIDLARWQAVMKELRATGRDDIADRLNTMVTPGSLSTSGVGGEAEDLGRLPVEQSIPRAMAQRAYNTFNYAGSKILHFQRILERPGQMVAGGAAMRQMLQEMGHSWYDANTNVSRLADEVAKGISDPAQAARTAQFMHRSMGQYNAFTGAQRAILRGVPFGSWYANAARLVFEVLPRDHPLFSVIMQDVTAANKQAWDAQHAGLPEDLQTALSVGPSAWLDLGRLTPVGLNAPLTSTAAQLVLPQFAGALHALAGQDPFGADLKGPNTPYGKSAAPGGIFGGQRGATGPAILSAVEQLVESMGGPINTIARALESKGGTLYNTSTPDLFPGITGIGQVNVKPGSAADQKGLLNLPGPLDKVFDPFHPTTYGAAGGSPSNLSSAGGGSLAGATSGSLAGATGGSLAGAK